MEKEEIDKLAKQEYAKLSADEANEIGTNYKKSGIKIGVIGSLVSLAILAIAIICTVFLEDAMLFFVIVDTLSFFTIVAMIVVAITFKNLTIEEATLSQLRKKVAKENNFTAQDALSQILHENFTVTKSIKINNGSWDSSELFIDMEHRKFIIQYDKVLSKAYNFSDLINYEVYENGMSKVKGRAGSALIGGAFFGLAGLIIGSSMSRKIDENCEQLKLIIRINDIDFPQIVLTYIENTNINKTSSQYKNMKQNIQAICSELEFMMNATSLEQSANFRQAEAPSSVPDKPHTEQPEQTEKQSLKDKLKELKELLDEGLISEDDYELKKKNILNL